jgi:hypothetical protein
MNGAGLQTREVSGDLLELVGDLAERRDGDDPARSWFKVPVGIINPSGATRSAGISSQ